MRYIGKEEIEKMAIGAALLGTGGGGDPFIGKLMALQAIEKYGPVKLLSADELDDEALVVPSAMMGAPTVMVEKVPSGNESIAAFNALEEYLGRKITATMPIEAGGVNSLLPFALAARVGLPVVDADGMGRAFPELQMVTYYLDGINASPMVLADEKDNSIVLNAVDGVWTEKIARAATMTMGGSLMNAIYPMSGKQARESSIIGSLSFEEKLGDIIMTSKQPIDDLVEATNGYILFEGKIRDVERATDGGFVRGKAVFEGMNQNKSSECTLEFQNENLICLVDGQPKCLTPDLITVLDAETGMPITTEGLKFGMRVVILGMPCDPKWRTDKGIETVGPGYFGYDFEYQTIEALNQ
ncbi:DUF917 domain-containing protein [Salinicoccus cyprini]|uniref:DUF917 domain-containing protein n=1 Tax=Salinicoccus cyprini TaxID=2493691 RepID=A0A558AXE9_9STAP|nr:DUF917 domain-containing protein [Salinicoccus cyprini]TVT28930.1 DUF917 domain-containing protein [Salinicoccus cyprini]